MRVGCDTVEEGRFCRRRIRSLNLSGKVRRVESRAFSECGSLKEVTFSEGLKSIGSFAFQDSPLIRRFHLPSTLAEIEEDAFFIGYEGILEEFTVHPDNPAYRSVDGVLFSKDMETLIQFPQNKDLASYEVPETVRSIAPDAFAYARRLERIDLPEGLASIGSGAFEWCESLRSISIPDGVKEVPSYAFFCCYSLEEAELPDRLDCLGFESFANCTMLREFDIPPGFDQLDYAILGGCEALERVSIPEGVAEVNNSAFLGCSSLKEVRLPSTVVALWEKAFAGCGSLEEINIPPAVYHVSDDVFQGCESLRRIIVEGTIESRYWVPEGAEVVQSGLSPPGKNLV